ncbi:MAG TPA: hypothetical protein VGG08_03105 [Solirubrobacteraceae bacterium]|jgi:hypothetical protein
MRGHHRHHLLHEAELAPIRPLAHISADEQAERMRVLRAAQNQVATAYIERDRLIATWARNNQLSRHDMAVATGLAKTRIDQIIRELGTED